MLKSLLPRALLVVPLALAGCGVVDAIGGAKATTLAADYLEVLDASTGQLPVEETKTVNGGLFGPHAGVRIPAVGVSDGVDDFYSSWVGLDGAVAAEDGYELVFAKLSSYDARWDKETTKKTALALVAGDRTIDLAPKLTEAKLYPVAEPHSQTKALAISVKKGTPVTLKFTDDGHTQTLDLRTGKPGDDAVAGYYPLFGTNQLSRYYEKGAAADQSGESADYYVEVSMKSAALDPYVPGYGWAKAGRAWLTLGGIGNSSSFLVARYSATYRLTSSEAYTLVTPDGKRTGFGKQTVKYYGLGDDGASVVVVDVPAGTKTATLEIDPGAGEFSVADNGIPDARWVTKPPKGEITIDLTK